MKTKKARLMIDQSILPNFFRKLEKTPTCWLWKGCTANYGYGRIGTNRGQSFYAHRLSYLIHVGSIPEGLCVLHKCDVPRCVNPAHLYLGTPADNNADTRSKGRHAFGGKHGRAKLTEAQVLQIKQHLAGGTAAVELAKHFGVVPGTIRRIKRGINWQRTSGDIPLSPECVAEIKSELGKHEEA